MKTRLALITSLLLMIFSCQEEILLPVPPPKEIEPTKTAAITTFERIEDWPGFVRDTEHVKIGPVAAKWSNMPATPQVTSDKISHDWSPFNHLRVWVYSAKAVPTAFMMIAASENPQSEGPDYYGFRIDLNYKGWKEHKFVLSNRGRPIGGARSPLGLNHIQKLTFTASGWDNTPNPEALVYIDGLRLTVEPAPQGPVTSDAEFLNALDLNRAGMEKVKAACQERDIEKAKAELLAYMRTRTEPKWYFDWRDRPTDISPVKGGSDGWDYYSKEIVIDWKGWKHFVLKKSDLGISRKPIGWHRINSIRFGATGFNHTPDPKTTLIFDEVKLTGPEPVTLGGFEREKDFELWPGLEPEEKIVKEGKKAGRWENMHLTTAAGISRMPHDWTKVEALEFWAHANDATGAKIQLILDSDQPDTKKVDETAMKHRITIFPQTYPTDFALGDDIDWRTNPRKPDDPDYTPEWTYCLNRFDMWGQLGNAYWATGDEKYAKEWMAQLVDWVKDEPVPYDAGCGSPSTWRTIECGIRTGRIWMDTYYRFLGSPSLSPEVHAIFLESILEHGRRLSIVEKKYADRTGNWVIIENSGLVTAAVMFPEFKESKGWLKQAFARLDQEFGRQVYPDGCQKELTTGYHQVCINCFRAATRIAEHNNVPIPPNYMKKLEKLYEYDLLVMMPDGRTPPLNDGGRGDVRRYLADAAEIFHRPDFEWAATNGARGKKPDHDSHAFPYGGQYVMRSGWEMDDRYLILDAGPFGIGHQHEDNLSIYAWAYGRVLVTEPGNYTYDRSKWRSHILSSFAHNTIIVDGEGQRRAGQKESFEVDKPLPNKWFTGKHLDFAAGKYDWGYGSKKDKSVSHERKVIFVKPGYWVVFDRLVGEGRHTFESLFHLDAENAAVDPKAKSVRTTEKDKANILLAPLASPDLIVTIVKGQEDPVQGWIPSEKRPIPTAIFKKDASCPATFAYVLYPYPSGADANVKVSPIPVTRDDKAPPADQAQAIKIEIAGRGTDFIYVSHIAPVPTQFGDYETDAEVACIRLDHEGRTTALEAIGGRILNRRP
ncbi:MAG: alginate lyase family protein [Planctomycetota bacterium]